MNDLTDFFTDMIEEKFDLLYSEDKNDGWCTDLRYAFKNGGWDDMLFEEIDTYLTDVNSINNDRFKTILIRTVEWDQLFKYFRNKIDDLEERNAEENTSE